MRKCNSVLNGFLIVAAVAAIGCTQEHETSVDSRPFYTDHPPTRDCLEISDASLAHADADLLFNYDHVPVFDIFLPEQKWDDLIVNARNEEWEEAEVCFEGKSLGKIAIRFKGGVGTLFKCFDTDGKLICPRLSIKLKFSEYEKDKRFFGLKRLNLQGNIHDDSQMREKLSYDLYRSMGINAPRALWAMVRVNGESHGLFGMVENIDGRFTEDRWPDYPDGNLYKEVWPSDTDTTWLVEHLKTNEETADVSDFLGFSEAINAAANNTETQGVLEKYTDMEQWARYLAVSDTVGTCDGMTIFYVEDDMTSIHNHNYYFYADAPGHFSVIPWDLNCSFLYLQDTPAPAPHWTGIQEDCDTFHEYWFGFPIAAPTCDKVFAALSSDVAHVQRWRSAVQELLDGPFALQTIQATVDRHLTFMGREARTKETPQIYYPSFTEAVQHLKRTITVLRTRLEQRIQKTSK